MLVSGPSWALARFLQWNQSVRTAVGQDVDVCIVLHLIVGTLFVENPFLLPFEDGLKLLLGGIGWEPG